MADFSDILTEEQWEKIDNTVDEYFNLAISGLDDVIEAILEALGATTEYIVVAGAGHSPNPVFATEEEARARYDEERAVPSYIREGAKRHASIVRKITITTVIADSRK